jgi:tRNA U34 5-carboxymethylaminomethyl modifying enzyme MnmG/GidA
MLTGRPAEFELIVVGGGHVGCEAAITAARLPSAG